MKLRAASADDVDAMSQIMGDWFTVTPFVPRLHTIEQDRWFIGQAIGKTDAVVADNDGVKGFIMRDGEDIGQLYIAADARGQGIGTALLDLMKSRTNRLGLWCFQANTGARRFYERHGFVAERFTDGSDNEEKRPDIRYSWSAEI